MFEENKNHKYIHIHEKQLDQLDGCSNNYTEFQILI